MLSSSPRFRSEAAGRRGQDSDLVREEKQGEFQCGKRKVPLAEGKCHVVQDQEETDEIDTSPAVPRSPTWLVAPAGGQKNFLK